MPDAMASRGGVAHKPLVRADTELRGLAAGWCLTAAAVLAAALALGVDRFSQLEVGGLVLVLGGSVGCALGGVVLGRRTGPRGAYRQVFENAPTAPRWARGESNGRTTWRALTVALASSAGFVPAAVLGLTLVLLVLGKPREALLDHLFAASGLIAAGWMFVCALAARVVAAWFERWERERGKAILCAPLRSGMLAHVYYVTTAASDG